MKTPMNLEKQVILPEEVVAKAQERARSLGLSLTEYVQSLVVDDVRSLDDPWRQPLPWEVEKQYLLDEIEFYEEERKHPQQAAHSAEELVKLLDEESRQIDPHEADEAHPALHPALSGAHRPAPAATQRVSGRRDTVSA